MYMQPDRGTLFQRQFLPIVLTAVVCVIMILLVLGEIHILNRFTTNDIALSVRWTDVLIGLTVYLKTSIDFAIFIGNLMHTNSGWKNRISIEMGTALGNALGTMAVLLIWALFKEVDWLLALMIIIAAFVLFKLAQDGLDHAIHTDREYPITFKSIVHGFEVFLKHVNWFTRPVLRFILPDLSMNSGPRGGFWALFLFAITVPFVLGLDDFAGYVPLFSIVNVFGFTVGVFMAHALLNMFLYLSPDRTIKMVKNPIIALLGSLVFVGLGAWGLYEAVHLLMHA
jgi:hypothetical protein